MSPNPTQLGFMDEEQLWTQTVADRQPSEDTGDSLEASKPANLGLRIVACGIRSKRLQQM